MKKTVIIITFFVFTLSAHAQRLATVGILPFEAVSGIGAADAAEATRLVIAEMSSWGIMTVLSGDEAENGEYLVRGQVSRQNNHVVFSAATILKSTGRTLNNSKEEAPSMSGIPITAFCAQIAENIPFPNYMLGRWRSTIDMIDGPVTCILEFRSDRTIRVQQYDTWEHNGTNILKYQAIGTGTYSYAGYLRRTVTVGGRMIEADATVGINLNLEDALPKYVKIEQGGLRVLFNEAKTSFELVSGSLPCGDNLTGPSVYPNSKVFYTKFTKI